MGSALGAKQMGEAKPLYDVIKQLPRDTREQLYYKMLTIINSFQLEDGVKLVVLFSQNDLLRGKMLHALQHFATNDLNLKIA